MIDSAELLVTLADALTEIGEADIAIPAYCRAMEIDSGIPLIYNRLGAVLEQVDRADDALMIYKQAVAIHVGDEETHQRLENLQIEMSG